MTFLSKYGIQITAVIALVTFLFWILYNPTKSFTTSVPGMDSVPSNDLSNVAEVKIGEHFSHFASENNPLSGEWPCFRGSDHDNIVKNSVPLKKTFGGGGPDIRWSVDLGEGHAAPVISQGKVYILDYIEEEKKDAMRCFSLENGRELWRRSYDVHVKRNHGMSRTTPAIEGDRIVSIGPLGHVMCLDKNTGDFHWGLDMVKEYATEIPFWYTGQCPLIDNGQVILATGGKAIMIAVDIVTGEILWESPNPDSLQMSHSSIMPLQIQGKKNYVYAGIGGIVGISGELEEKGKQLWFTREFAPSVVAPSPILLSDNRLFASAGYGAGSVIFTINKNWELSIETAYKPKEGLASEQQTPVIIANRIYGILPKDAGSLRNQMACYSLDNLNDAIWTSGKSSRFGLGPYIYADGRFYIVSDDGSLTIAEVTDRGFNELDRYRVIEGHDAWGPIAIADGYLLMRDSKKMLCLNMRA